MQVSQQNLRTCFPSIRATFPVHFFWLNHSNKPSRGVKRKQSKLGNSRRYEGEGGVDI